MMKERIKELAIQAGDDWDHTLESDKEFLANFAELIVQECAQVGEDTDGNWNVKNNILKHFGVK